MEEFEDGTEVDLGTTMQVGGTDTELLAQLQSSQTLQVFMITYYFLALIHNMGSPAPSSEK